MAVAPTRKVVKPAFRGYHRAAKTLMDRGGAAVVLLVAAPWFGLIALAVWLEGPGSVFTRERRIGQWGQEFSLLRFRRPARGISGELTRLGSFLGQWSLDELPQLVNVLLGDMSFVGPRPRATHIEGQYALDLRRLLLKPGLTGLWRGSRRADPLDDEPVDLDWYLENWSVRLDLTLLWRSVRSVLRHARAH